MIKLKEIKTVQKDIIKKVVILAFGKTIVAHKRLIENDYDTEIDFEFEVESLPIVNKLTDEQHDELCNFIKDIN